ncbi:hypothetical protein GCM10010293_62110 [Streptomyces griseoflavus]|uniref:hypothetical protein n=1 Tax=Streptomyces griseoflavus TaxID=35619 RepID=UPI00167E6513|nr:hypothetical protein [Streptomyces griseoflavus]GGV50807.1 hypothetical protein GCM10010293_62110 [Streptomyces griseoflavus]
MNDCSASQMAENASSSCTRLILGSDASPGTFPSTWTWAAAISLAALLTSTYFSVYQIRKSKRAKQTKRFQPDYDLLDETVVLLDKLAGTTAHKTDLTRLGELLSRIKQAERRFPDLPLGTVVAHIDAYRKTPLPDDFQRKLATKKIPLDDLLNLSRQQGAAIANALTAISAVQNEIDRRTH